jgi:precorrin-4 methylase
MRSDRRPVALLAVLALAVLAGCSGSPKGPGKLYLVGMGTANDLITLRGVEAIQKADIILLHDDQGKEDWKEFIGDKEVWIFPRFNFLYLGIDPETLTDPEAKALCVEHDRDRREIVERIRKAVESGKTLAILDNGDPMMYGVTWYFEMLPKDLPSEVIPGVGAFESSAAAVKMTPVYGWDTNSVIVTMADWEGRVDTNERLMATGTSMIFYTMHMDFPKLFEQLKRHYPADTPVAMVCWAGDRERQKVLRSTVGRFLDEVDLKSVPLDKNLLLVGKFLTCGQARKDGLESGRRFMENMRFQDRVKAGLAKPDGKAK